MSYIYISNASHCTFVIEKVVHEKVRDDKTLWREREREEEDAGGKLSHPFFVQSQLSACCFGNVMSAQPLAIPLRLLRREHRGGCARVALYKIS